MIESETSGGTDMPEEPKPEEPKPTAAEPTDPLPEPAASEDEKDAGDFITRHVLEKDSVFFEG
jgi:hypothetical protein